MAGFLFDAEVGRAGAGGRWWEVEVVGRPVVRLEPVGRQSPPREPRCLSAWSCSPVTSPPGASLSGVAAEARDGAPAGSSRGLADARRSVPRPDLQRATTASPGSGVAAAVCISPAPPV